MSISSPLARYSTTAEMEDRIEEWNKEDKDDKYGASVESDKTLDDTHPAFFARKRRQSCSAFTVGAINVQPTISEDMVKKDKIDEKTVKEKIENTNKSNETSQSTRGQTYSTYSKGERNFEVGGWWA